LQKLGVAVYAVDAEAFEKFRATFAAPMSPSKEEALQALFGSDFDSVAWNLNLIGLEDKAI
jgi:hypothetical protein